MYARVQTLRPLPPEQADPNFLLDVIEKHPGFAGVYAMEQIADSRGMLITLWENEADAHASSDRTREQLGPRPFALESDQVYEVFADVAGGTAGGQPQVAAVLHFDGPISEVVEAAAERAHRDRIAPIVTGFPGLVRGLVIRDPETRAAKVMNFGVSIDALEASRDAVRSAPLLPGEDPALLMGPDRAEVYHVRVSR